jgi:cyclophilin family peptidyl-prolyl cis-trans isomerase
MVNVPSIFGEVIDGMDIVRKTGRVSAGADDRPVDGIVIEKIVVQRVVQ